MFLTVKIMASTNTFTLVFYRSLVQIVISLGSLMEKGLNPLGPPGWVRVELAARAVFGGIAVAAWFYGIQILPLPDAVTLQFTTPPFAAAFAVIMVGEHWKPLDMMGAVVCCEYSIIIITKYLPTGEQKLLLQFRSDTFCFSFRPTTVLGVVLIAHPSWLFGNDDGSSSSS